MTPPDPGPLSKLLHCFDVSALGDGDALAGANTLAAMALTLSSLNRPDSALAGTDDGSRVALGCGFVVSGALSAGLVAEKVVAPLNGLQNHALGNIRHWYERLTRDLEDAKLRNRLAEFRETYLQDDPPVLMEWLRYSDMMPGEGAVHGRKLFGAPPGWGFREARDHPLVFASAGSPKELERLMELAHLGRLLAHVEPSSAEEAGKFAGACRMLAGGRHLHERVRRNARGEVMVTDPCEVLGEALRGGGAAAAWLSRLPWLSDRGADPGLRQAAGLAADPLGVKLDDIHGRFREALVHTLSVRMNRFADGPLEIKGAFAPLASRWVGMLGSEFEPLWPGITGVARPLAAGLWFGLRRMSTVMAGDPEKPRFNRTAVLEFARLLVRRMVNTRSLLLHEGSRARIGARAETLRRKLADGPQTARELCRRSYRLSASECGEALELLEISGAVVRDGVRWRLAAPFGPAGPVLPTPNLLTVDV